MNKLILIFALTITFNIQSYNNQLWVEYFKTKQCSEILNLESGDTLICYNKNISNNDKNIPDFPILTDKFWNIDVSKNNIKDSFIFENVNYIVNDFNLHSNFLFNIDGLKNLQHVGRFINISNNPILNINGLSNLKYAQGIYITHTGIINVDGLSNIKHLNFDLFLQDNHINDLNGLINLRSVNRQINLSYNNISNLNGLKNLESVSIIDLRGNHNLDDISGLSSLKSVDLILIDNKIFNNSPRKGSSFCNNILVNRFSIDGKYFLNKNNPIILNIIKQCFLE